MIASRPLLLTALAVACIATTVSSQQNPSGSRLSRPVALVGGTLIDGTGGVPVRNSVVLIRGERIEKIGTVGSLSIGPEYEQIPTDGMTVMPGLWDLHVHLMYGGHPNGRYWIDNYASQFERVTMPASALQMLMAGVTSVRDLGAPPSILAVKRRIASGELSGPTLYVAGPVLSKGGGAAAPHVWNVADVSDARAKTRQLLDDGVDWIKLLNAEQWSLEELRAVVQEAHARGRKVAAHAFSEAEIRQGLAAGVDDFQHLRTQTSEYPPDLMASIRARVTAGPPLYWTATVGGNGQLNAAYLASNPEYLDDPSNFLGMPPAMADEVRKAIAARTGGPGAGGAPGRGVGAGRGGRGGTPQPQSEIDAIVKRKVGQLRDAGVELVFGTDVGSWGEVTSQAGWMEADLWVRELGIDPMTVIRKMTLDAARLMGAERESGSIAEGKYADVIAVGGDPLRHVNVLREPRIVIKHGRRFK